MATKGKPWKPKAQVSPTASPPVQVDIADRPRGSFGELGQIGPIVGFIVAIAYGCGFIIINTFLAKYGVFEADFLKPAYLSIGCVFLFTMGAFWVIALRLVPALNQRRDYALALQARAGKTGPGWQQVALYSIMLDLVFWCCIAVLGGEMLLSSDPPAMTQVAFYAWAMGMMLFSFIFFGPASHYITHVTYLYVSALQAVICGVTVFYAGAVGRGLGIIFFNLLFVGLFVDAIIRSRGVDRTFLAYLGAACAILGSVAFGLWVYPNVRIAFGGGSVQLVEIVLKAEDLPENLARLFHVRDRIIQDVRVLSESAGSLVLAWPGNAPPDQVYVLRLDKSAVAAIITPARGGDL